MTYIAINLEIIDSFRVLNKHGVPVTGLTQSDFTIKLYNPNKNNVANIPAGVIVDLEELSDGFYRVNFIPDTLGAWNLIVINTTYIPSGVGEDYFCVENLGGISPEIEDMIKRTLGLSQENFKITNQIYDSSHNLTSAITKIYPSALDMENNTNVIAEYKMTAVFDRNRKLLEYKSERVA